MIQLGFARSQSSQSLGKVNVVASVQSQNRLKMKSVPVMLKTDACYQIYIVLG